MSVLVCLLVLGVAGVRIMAEEQMEPQTEFLEHSRSFKVGNVWLLGGIVSIEIFWGFRIQFFSIFLYLEDEFFCIDTFGAGEPVILQDAWFKYMYLYDLKVVKDYRHQGISTALIEKARGKGRYYILFRLLNSQFTGGFQWTTESRSLEKVKRNRILKCTQMTSYISREAG